MTKQIQNPKPQTIKKLLPKTKTNISLKNYTTFKIGGSAKYFFIAKTKKDLIKAVEAALSVNLPFFILGGGSNVLVSDEGYKGLVVKCQMPALYHPSPAPEQVRCGIDSAKIGAGSNVKCQTRDSRIEIVCEAGVMLKDLVSESARQGFTGLEWAAGIPGTVGGAVRGNAGAFEESMADVVKSVEVLEITNYKNQKSKCKNFTPHQNLFWCGARNDNAKFKIKKYNKENCQFSYRESIFKKNPNLIILSAEVLFQKGDKRKIKQKIKENLNYRKKRHPLNFPSSGSVFKNPRKVPAAELIERSGLKGKKIGKAQISKKHCNFIINLGGAKAKDVRKLIKLVKQKVKEKFRIKLEEEIAILSDSERLQSPPFVQARKGGGP